MPDDDATRAWVLRARRGDPAAFEALARAYLRAAYSVALAVVGRPADAEDVAQDALFRAFEKIDTCRDPARFGGWLMQITRNQALSWLDKRRLRDVPAALPANDPVDSSPAPDAGAARNHLVEALATLAPAPREVVLLHDLDGWTHKEIAAALGISEVMSRQHLFHARRALRAKLGEVHDG